LIRSLLANISLAQLDHSSSSDSAVSLSPLSPSLSRMRGEIIRLCRIRSCFSLPLVLLPPTPARRVAPRSEWPLSLDSRVDRNGRSFRFALFSHARSVPWRTVGPVSAVQCQNKRTERRNDSTDQQ